MREDKKTPLPTVSVDQEVSIGGDLPSPSSEADYLRQRLLEALAIPKDLFSAPKPVGAVKVVSLQREGDAYVALLESPIDSIEFYLKVSDGKPSEEP